MRIPFRLFQHSGSVDSLEQAARERGQSPDQVVRSLVFRLAKGEFVMVLVAGDRQVSWPALRRFVGRSRVSLAGEAEVLAATGYARGAVSPFGLPQPMRVLIDESVIAQSEISIGSGLRGTAVLLRSEDLLRALADADHGRFSEL
jgi:Cys-tRNA(Pro) deacylase